MPSKSIYNADIEDYIAQNHSLGLPLTRIAQALGITDKAIYNWVRRKKTLKVKIANLELAEARDRIASVPASWWLERKFPEHFKDPNKDQTVTVNLTVQHLIDAKQSLIDTPGLDDVIDVTGTEIKQLGTLPDSNDE